MFIKQVIIQGITSYQERTEIEPFHQGLNIIFGKNGSGKSNIYYAIQLLLSQEFSVLTIDKRRGLIHQSSNTQLESPFVEIIFDNSDRRLPTDEKEVSIRRVIDLKKDQLFLNKKTASRSDVTNLFESAGISLSNPYYIVKQGTIYEMAMASDHERLEMLLELAGAKVYDEACKNLLNSKIRETENITDQILDGIETIEDHLQMLTIQTEKFEDFEQFHKRRLCLEYAILQNDLNDKKNQLNEINQILSNNQRELDHFKKLEEKKAQIQESKNELEEAKNKRNIIKAVCDALSKEEQELVDDDTSLSLKIDKLMEVNQHENDESTELENSDKEKKLEEIKQKYNDAILREQESLKQLELKIQERKELYDKRARFRQFPNKDERDAFIKNELSQLENSIDDEKRNKSSIKEAIKKNKEKIAELTQRIKKDLDDSQKLEQGIIELQKKKYTLSGEHDKIQAERKNLLRKKNDLQLKLDNLNQEIKIQDNYLRKVMSRSIIDGLDSLQKVLETWRNSESTSVNIESNYYGPVYENFKCDRMVYKAVERTAGNRLFQIIVKDENFGLNILNEFDKQDLPGEITFIPLERLHVKQIIYPQDERDNAYPMISIIKYDSQVDRAMQLIFGKTLCCRNLDTATRLAEKFECVTLEGDKVSSKGSFCGGYDNYKSRMEILKYRSEIMQARNKIEEQLLQFTEKIQNNNELINKNVSKQQREEACIRKQEDIFEKVKAIVYMKKEELATIQNDTSLKEIMLLQCSSNLEAMRMTKSRLEEELKQNNIEVLTPASSQVEDINNEILELSKESDRLSNERINLESQKNNLEYLIDSFQHRKDQLNEQRRTIQCRQMKIVNLTAKQTIVKNQLNKLSRKLIKKKEELAQIKTEIKDIKKKLSKYERQERDMEEEYEQSTEILSQTMKKQILENSIRECKYKIANLGALPNVHAYQMFNGWSKSRLMKEMIKINEKLGEFDGINRLAYNQMKELNARKEAAKERIRLRELQRINIKETMEVLEQATREAILSTFEKMKNCFGQVFYLLAPNGEANLILKTCENEHSNMPDIFTGVGIEITFNKEKDSMQNIQQLSGGQRSLVALALIFAIQKCDPAPFYLFDEIDQALDQNHREVVAFMIKELSSNAQFIVTTFKRELWQYADQFYEVQCQNNKSRIRCHTPEEMRQN